MKLNNIENRLDKAVTELRGIISNILMIELLMDEADKPGNARPNPVTLDETLGSIRTHLERIEGDITEILHTKTGKQE